MEETNNLERINHSKEIAWKHREIENFITERLREVLILSNMKTEKYHSIPMLEFNQDWEIVEGTEKYFLKDPVGITGKVEDIHLLNILKEIGDKLNQDQHLSAEEKNIYFASVRAFFASKVANTLRTRLDENTPLGKTLKKYWMENHEGKIDRIDRDIYMSMANRLYYVNPQFLLEEGGFSDLGLQYLSQVFFNTIHKASENSSTRAIYKIFHDKDFSFLYTKGPDGEINKALPKHYVAATRYLMDAKGFNAYQEDGEKGNNEWNNKKNTCLNNLYRMPQSFVKIKHELSEDTDISNKEKTHRKLAKLWENAVEAVKSSYDFQGKNLSISFCYRRKTDASIFTKQSLGDSDSIDDISDYSGVRVIYHGDLKNNQEMIEDINTKIYQIYFDSLEREGLIITNTFYDKKGNLVSKEYPSKVIQSLPQLHIKKRPQKHSKYPPLKQVYDIYASLNGEVMHLGLQDAYLLISQSKGGVNGDYNDFKLGGKVHDTEYDEIVGHEVSSYNESNDIDLKNHDILDLEKNIEKTIKGRKKKSVSINTLRLFTEGTIKDISYKLDMYENAIEKGEIAKPYTDDYQYMDINGKKISLRDLLVRTAENSERFDIIICHILNYFIKQKKLVYLNQEGCSFYGIITPEIIQDKHTAKERRMISSSVVANLACDKEFFHNIITMYKENDNPEDKKVNFISCLLKDLGDVIKHCLPRPLSKD